MRKLVIILVCILLFISCSYEPQEINVTLSSEESWTFLIDDQNGNKNELFNYLRDHGAEIEIWYGLKENNYNGRRSGYSIFIDEKSSKVENDFIEVKCNGPSFDEYEIDLNNYFEISDIFLIVPYKNASKSKRIDLMKFKNTLENEINKEYNSVKYTYKKKIENSAIKIDTFEFYEKYSKNPISQTEIFGEKYLTFYGITSDIIALSSNFKNGQVTVDDKIKMWLSKEEIMKIEIGKKSKYYGRLSEENISSYYISKKIVLNDAFVE